ncbi:MAG: hypothetical protein AUK35_07795 [Zetaproteobacteria bacterium CG2_30_46_52]|nr:MAG: hypothetical protein AUK35_07795 [Zetaproteobacteria bacterium CG2_30_46_52]
MFRLFAISVLLSFLLVPPAFADDKGFFSSSWDSISSFFSDDEKDNHEIKADRNKGKTDQGENKKKHYDKNDGNALNRDNGSGGTGGGATTTPPTIIPPVAVTIEATGAQNTVFAGVATATDSAGNVLVVTNDTPATFPVGITTVTYTVTDIYGNIATTTQTVTVTDTTAPTLTIQQPAITVEATAPQMTVALGIATATDIVDGVLVPTNNAPATFPLGVTTVTYTATDTAGNAATAQQQVTVQDTTPPVITPPAAVTGASQDGYAVAITIGTATATDAFNPVTITNNAPATFPIGNTTVIWTATDANNNSSTATQLVTVTDNSIFANLPPDPGAAGEATLEGIDSDGDGVRDDVQRWIVMSYPNSEKTRAALRQLAVDYQNSILDVTSKAVVINNFISMQRTLYCLSYIILDFYDVSPALKSVVLNTSARSRAYLRGDYLLSGEVIEGLGVNYGKQGCNFNPDVMPN